MKKIYTSPKALITAIRSDNAVMLSSASTQTSFTQIAKSVINF